MSIRREVSGIFNYTITADEKGTMWDEAFDSLVKEGRVTRKHILLIIVLLLKREEARENDR